MSSNYSSIIIERVTESEGIRSMIDKEQISKKKYVYHVYLSHTSGDTHVETLHIEKHPLIYANSSYLYYKDARYSRLSCIEMYRVYDCLDLEKIKRFISNRSLNCYYWNVDENAPQLFNELRSIQNEVEKQRAIDKITADYIAAKRAFERAKKKYDTLPDEAKRDDTK